MYTTLAACLASYYLGFYTWMYVTMKPLKNIKTKKDTLSNEIKYKQL